jgi:hypothetical protein
LSFAQQTVDNRFLTISLLVRSNYDKVGVMDETQLTTDERQWFVMRDLKRRNAKQPAYLMFKDKGMEFFTPMVHKLLTIHGKREDREVPFMQDLLFVKETKEKLDIIVEAIPTLQYRYKLGVQHTPIVVRNTDMERFIKAVEATENPKYYRPEEITPDMLNRKIRIIGGQLDGYTGTLVTTRGSKTKRILVELPMLLAAAVDVKTEFIQLV